MNQSPSLEQQARAVGDNRQALLKRLIESRSCLVKALRQEFTPYFFDFKNKRLVSKSGLFFLQWAIRSNPGEPISYENQQTSKGIVYVVRNYRRGGS